MGSRQNGKKAKWKAGKMGSRQNGKQVKWEVGEMRIGETGTTQDHKVHFLMQ